ncbi:MAG: bacillithiol biosynthesis deacetylase BshB1 [Chitinophagales bacterium]|nr:bacillithiol biosynthesis deacetylase BshB1 [Chitinophagales bacterium]
MKLDILAIGAHPDDIELACSGTLLKHAKMGKKVGVLDLTKGQLGTRGTPEQRLQEANDAAKILKLAVRENLQMEDGYFVNDADHQKKIITAIRKYRPDVLLINAPDDRHPDHGKAAQLAKDAAFYAGLRKIETTFQGVEQKAWRPKNVYHYIQAKYLKPDFVVDISEEQEEKMKAILAYKSQFYNPNSNEPDTFISSNAFLQFVEARGREMGQICEVAYAEGFIGTRYLGVHDLSTIF